MISETKRLSQLPEEHLLKDLRNLETKMGFVLTLVRPSTSHAPGCADRYAFCRSFKLPFGVSSTNKPLRKMSISMPLLTRRLCNSHGKLTRAREVRQDTSGGVEPEDCLVEPGTLHGRTWAEHPSLFWP